MLLFILSWAVLTGSAHARWGAEPQNLANKPALAWTTLFSQKADVVATGDITRAISQCDKRVGAGNYCAVELRSATPSKPFSIERSKTKVFARTSGQPVVGKPGQATISIGSNIDKVLIENLELVGTRAGRQPIHAIVIAGERIKDIAIRRNQIHHFDSDASAHGIVVLGSGNTREQRIQRITIDQNHLHDMQTGSSETIAINGNVTDWIISNNRIARVNNIAIDAIGGEGTAPTVTLAGRVVPSPLDTARNGWIENNTVSAVSTRTNPAYGYARSWAGAIYVDGGRNITITGNTVRNAPWAYDIGAENCVTTENIILRNNTAVGSHFGDLRLGGYTETGYLSAQQINCDPHTSEDANEGHGYVRRVTVSNNNFLSANTVLPRIFVEYRTTESIIAESGMSPEPGRGNGIAVGDSNAYRITE